MTNLQGVTNLRLQHFLSSTHIFVWTSVDYDQMMGPNDNFFMIRMLFLFSCMARFLWSRFFIQGSDQAEFVPVQIVQTVRGLKG